MAKWGDISRAFNCTESNDTPNKPDTQIDEWDTMAEAARFALDQLIFKGDKLADRIEELEAKLRKSALQELSALGQASEAYQAQLAAEAKLAKAEDFIRRLERFAAQSKDGFLTEKAQEALAELKGGEGDA